MKQQITFKSFFVVICLLLSFNLHAQDVPPVTINVEKMGTLSDLIPSGKKYIITDLTLSGNLCGLDFRFIREMAGGGLYKDSETSGKLTKLNLANANIVRETGNAYSYYERYEIYNNNIPDYLFAYLSNLTSIILPNNVTSISSNAFYGCTGLKSITIPNSLTSSVSFSDCTGLTSFNIGNSIAPIYGNFFYGCSKLEEFIVSEDNTKYSSVEGVLFSKDKTKLIAYPKVKSNIYAIPIGVTSIDYAFSGCKGLTSITIPNSITSIDGAFSGCTGLTSITIPNNITSIGNYTFQDCTGLTSVTIPNSVTSIGKGSFAGCTSLTELHCKALAPPTATSSSFTGTNKATCKLYVTKGTYPAYWIAAGWGDFTNIIEEKSTAISQTKASNTKVYTEQDAIILTGAELGDNISVYAESGALLQSTKVTDDVLRINVPTSHTYLIKTIDKTFKVAL